jgi:uncharacterized repeat protein (TIGR04042 family)
MPAMHYRLRWPDGSETRCYSPSLVVREHLAAGTSYTLPEFLQRIRIVTRIASDRVAAKYGFACSRAADELLRIEAQAGRFAGSAGAEVCVIAFET